MTVNHQPNVPRDALPWAHALTAEHNQLVQKVSDNANDTLNKQSNINATMGLLGSKIANIAGSVATQVAAAMAGLTLPAGDITAGTLSGSVTIAGSVNTAGTVVATDLYTLNGPGYNITGTRVAAWLESATGRVGQATSSLRYKTAIVDATTDPTAILSLSAKYYSYKSEVAKRDDPTSPDYVGPDYHVPTNIGLIAEDFQAAGLWEFINYQYYGCPCGTDTFITDEDGVETRVLTNAATDEHPAGTLVLDDNGQPVPEGLHYEIFSVAVLIATQSLNTRLTALEERVTNLEGSK